MLEVQRPVPGGDGPLRFLPCRGAVCGVPYGTLVRAREAHPTLKRGANLRCAYGAWVCRPILGRTQWAKDRAHCAGGCFYCVLEVELGVDVELGVEVELDVEVEEVLELLVGPELEITFWSLCGS